MTTRIGELRELKYIGTNANGINFINMNVVFENSIEDGFEVTFEDFEVPSVVVRESGAIPGDRINLKFNVNEDILEVRCL